MLTLATISPALVTKLQLNTWWKQSHAQKTGSV